MSDGKEMAQTCAFCGKKLKVFSYSWETFFAARRNREEIAGYGCGSCGSVICADCREKTIKWSAWDGFDKARCPKCAKTFTPIRVFVDRGLSPEDVQKAVKHLKLMISVVLDKDHMKKLPRMGEAFLDLGEPGIEALLSQIDPAGKGVTPTSFSEAARILAEIGEPRAIAGLAAVLAGDLKSKGVLDLYRAASVEPLARLDPEGSVKLFEDILVREQEPMDLRVKSAELLARLNPKGLVKLLEDILVREQEAMDLRVKSAELLGSLGTTESVVPLNQVLGNIKWSQTKLVAAAAGSLGKIGDGRSVEPLIAALKILDPEAKARIAEALGKLNDSRAVDPLKKHLAANHPGLRQAAAVALNNLGWRPADEKDQAVLAKSLLVEKERFCFSCDRPVGDAKSCPHCRTELLSKPKSPALASLLGYLFGGLIGGMALLVMTLVGAALKYEIDLKIRMLFFAVFAISAWKGMKVKLSTARDLAVLKPKDEAAKSAGRDLPA